MICKYNIADLNSLLEDFYILTSIRIAIYDQEFNEVTSYPKQLCNCCNIIRSDSKALENCLKGDVKAFMESRKTSSFIKYECHAGLIESVVPVLDNGIVIAYIMYGQVISNENKDIAWKNIKNKCANYNLNMKELKKAVYKKEHISEEKTLAASRIMEMSAKYLREKRMAVLTEDSLPVKIDKYINENLHNDICTEDIFNKFDISRSRLYKIANDNFGCGIANYIRNLRINRAKELLTTTSDDIGIISYKVGISDYNYFTKIFKREVGVTPSKFRKISKI